MVLAIRRPNAPAEDQTQFARWTREQKKGEVLRLPTAGAKLSVVRLDPKPEKRADQIAALYAGAPVEVRDAAVANNEALSDDDYSDIVATAIISNERVDSYDSTLNVEGWETNDHNRNPVVLFAHASWELPVARDLGKFVDLSRRAFIATCRFVSKKLGEQESKCGLWVNAGLLNATSVGFEPLEWEVAEDRDDGSSWWVPIDFLRQLLREWSWVPVPANADCLVDARAVLAGTGLSVREFRGMIEEAIEQSGAFYVPKSTLLALHRGLPGTMVRVDMGALGAFDVRAAGDLVCPACGHEGPASEFTPADEPAAEDEVVKGAQVDNSRDVRNDAAEEARAPDVKQVSRVLNMADMLARGALP